MNLVDVMDRAFRTVVRGRGKGATQPKAVTEQASTLMGTSLSLILTVGPLQLCVLSQDCMAVFGIGLGHSY